MTRTEIDTLLVQHREALKVIYRHAHYVTESVCLGMLVGYLYESADEKERQFVENVLNDNIKKAGI